MKNRKTWFRMQADGGTGKIEIFDEIGIFGVSAKEFSREVKNLGDVDQIEVHINSPGGAVFDGLAMFNVLRSHEASIRVFVDGIAASAASLVAMAGDEIIMPANTMMMIHNPIGFAIGDSDAMTEMAEALQKVGSAIVATYRNKTGLKDEIIQGMMDETTWMAAEEAVELGFADRVDPEMKIAAYFDLSRYSNIHGRAAERYQSKAKQGGKAMPNNKQTKPGDELKQVRADLKKLEEENTSLKALAEMSDAEKTHYENLDDDAKAAFLAKSPDERQKDIEAGGGGGNKGKVVSMADARRQGVKYATEVHELCNLAGHPEMASDFITKKTDIENVRKSLLAARAAEDDAITSQHNGGGKPGLDWPEVLAKHGFSKKKEA